MVCDHLKKIGNDFTVAIAHANLISFRKFLDQSDSLKSFKNKRRTNEIKNNEISHILCPKSYFGTGTYISMFKKMDINESLAQVKKSCCSLYDPIDSWSNFHSVFIFSEGFSEWLLKLWWWRYYTYINLFFRFTVLQISDMNNAIFKKRQLFQNPVSHWCKVRYK